MLNKIILLLFLCLPFKHIPAQKQDNKKTFTDSFSFQSCHFLSKGHNTYFILEPGYRQILAGKEGKNDVRLQITVLPETKTIGNVETRIVEEHESVNGQVVEISRNYFAICTETNSVFYFGEEVDIYKNGKIVGHAGAWVAEGKNKPGLMMPGLPLLGARYYQEIAPAIAMDRAEIISLSEMMQTPAGKFSQVLKVEETTPLEPNEKSYKFYAPGIGLIKDGQLVLIKQAFVK